MNSEESRALRVGALLALGLAGVIVACAGEQTFVNPTGAAGVAAREVCGDGADNDGDGQTDCADTDCGALPGCQATSGSPTLSAPFEVCARIEGDRSKTPVDLIWTVDSSPSMGEEMGWIQQNLNDFVSYLTGVAMDVRVVLLGGDKICVPEPLAGPDCGDAQRLLHIREYVGSHDSLEKIISLYPKYKAFLSHGGRKALVMTTDDDAEMSAAAFRGEISRLAEPGFGDDYVVHSIVAYGTHPKGCLTGAARGSVYLELSDDTHGIKYPICETDWSRIFTELADGIIGMVDLPCAYKVPPAPEGKSINPAQIHVTYSEANQRLSMKRLGGAGECAPGTVGWFFDQGAQTVRLCPDLCKSIRVSAVEVQLGCHDAVD